MMETQVNLEVDLSGSGRRRSNRIAKEQCKIKMLETASKELSLMKNVSHSTNSINDSSEGYMSPTGNTPLTNPQRATVTPKNPTPPQSPHHDLQDKPLSSGMEEKCNFTGTLKRKFVIIDKEIAEIKKNMQDLMNHCMRTNKFALKVMHASTTTLCNVQEKLADGKLEADEDNKDLFLFLQEEWARTLLSKQLGRKN